MNKDIKQILDDLYKLEPSFKKHEKRLIKLIEKLLSAKPDLKINPAFARTLRVQLMERAEELQAVTSNSTFSFANMFKRFIYPFAGGAIVTALIFVTIVTINSQMGNPQIAFKTEITKLSDNAFGPLSGLSDSGKAEPVTAPLAPQETGTAKSKSAVSPKSVTNPPKTVQKMMAVPQAMEAESADAAVSEPAALNARSMAVSDSVTVNSGDTGVSGSSSGSAGIAVPVAPPSDLKMMPPYQPTEYKYVYNGKTLDLTDEKVNVYRRKTASINDSSLVSVAQSFGFGTIDLKGFNNLSVQNISLAQNEKNGYIVGLDFVGQTINIYQNWAQWTQPFDKCGNDQKCYEDLQLKLSDVPADAEIIKISNDFLNKYGVDASVYGKPTINRDWASPIAYDMGVKSEVANTPAYIPEEMQVTYPLLIDGAPVMDESGNAYGLNVSVNIRQKSVSNVNNLRPNTLESSAYDAVIGFKAILDYLETAGNAYSYAQEGAKTVEVQLGEPEKVMVVLWRNSTDRQNTYEEYFVPALKFPITQKPDEYFYRNSIVVPLAKEMLTQPENPIAVPMMR